MRHTTVAEDHGNVILPKSSPSKIINAAPTIKILPTQSIAFRPAKTGVCGEGSFKKKSNTINTTAPMGKLIQKHHRQLTLVAKLPPMTGPIALPIAHTTDVIARYSPRSRRENVSQMMMLTVVPMPEDPRPCNAHPAIRECMDGARAQSRLPPRNMVSAIKRIGLRPHISANEPQTGVLAVLARMNALPIQT